MKIKDNIKLLKIKKQKRKLIYLYKNNLNASINLANSIDDLEKLEYALKLCDKIFNDKRLSEFQLVARNKNLLNSKFYYRCLDIFMKQTNYQILGSIKYILCSNILMKSDCYELILEILENNKCQLSILLKLIDTFFFNNTTYITPGMFKYLISSEEHIIDRICFLINDPSVNSQKVTEIITKIYDQYKETFEIQLEKILILFRKILNLENKEISRQMLKQLYNEICLESESLYDKFLNNFNNELINKRIEIAKQKEITYRGKTN